MSGIFRRWHQSNYFFSDLALKWFDKNFWHQSERHTQLLTLLIYFPPSQFIIVVMSIIMILVVMSIIMIQNVFIFSIITGNNFQSNIWSFPSRYEAFSSRIFFFHCYHNGCMWFHNIDPWLMQIAPINCTHGLCFLNHEMLFWFICYWTFSYKPCLCTLVL